MTPGASSRKSALLGTTSRTVAMEASGDAAYQRVDEGGENSRCFDDLRGVRWRIDLGILPSTSSVDEIRRVTADCRRR